MLTLDPEPKVTATTRTGSDPFEVTFSQDGATAFVSDFLGDSISVIDMKTAKTVATIRAGKQPAMLTFAQSGGKKVLAVANTGTTDVWMIDPATRKLVTRIPVGSGAHGVVGTPSGKLYVTNSTDNTVTVIDQAQAKALKTIAVANNPNGLTYLPNPVGR